MTSFDNELKIIERRLSELERERNSLLERKQTLLVTYAASQDFPGQEAHPLSTQQKVDLFRSLFRGRENIHAVRWENNQGRNGYALACDNEWEKGLCNKPKVKCGECPNQAFQPLDHEALYEHLSGQRTVGLYPLLDDDKTWLLAVDFVKSDWQRAAAAFREACGQWEIPCGVERSRSGNGAHVWIFFEQSLPAKDARRLGFALLDKAMELHAVLSFDSYDRLFPNQDILPTGGFGNLIALPLQRVPRKSGNTGFVDEGFNAYADQWAFLQALQKVSVSHVYYCLDKLDTTADRSDVELKPWEKGLPLQKSVVSNCLETVKMVHVAFDQDTAGLHHLCFRARSNDDVDRIFAFVESELDARIIHGPEDGSRFSPGYYSILFEDPDGIRIEVNYVPGKGHFGDKGRLSQDDPGPSDKYGEEGL